MIHKMLCKPILMLILIASAWKAGAQDSSKVEKQVTIIPYPFVYYSPETRFVFGAAATANIRFC